MAVVMKYVVQGDTDSGLVVHLAREDGLAACGVRPVVWHDRRNVPHVMVPIPYSGPVTCQRAGCKG